MNPSDVRDAAGRTWSARSGFDTGDYSPSYGSDVDIKGTNDDALYRSEMVRMNSWSRPMNNGTYKVTLKMREAWWGAPGARVFDVAAEGATVLSGVDIFKAVGKQAAYDRSFAVTVKDGRLDLGFRAAKDSALVSAILVEPATPTTPTTPTSPTTPTTPPTTTGGQAVARIGVAGTAQRDAAGNVYGARTGFSGGWYAPGYAANVDIKGTNDDALYRPEYVWANSWSHKVPNGTYDVTLKMREGFYGAAGQRVFDVSAEGSRKLADVDIFKAVGKQTAYDRTFRVAVQDGRLDLGFTNKRDAATVSGIVVATAGGGATPKPSPSPTTPAPKPTTPAPTPTPTPKPSTPAPSTNRPSGMIFDSGVYPMNKQAEVTRFEKERGRATDVIAVFPTRDSWPELQNTWWMDSQRIPANFKGTLNVGMPMWPKNGNLDTAARGGYNAEWEKFARTLAAKYPNAYVRPGWEMNIYNWYYAGSPANAEKWKQAFRHSVDSMRKAAPGLRIVWNPNEGPSSVGTSDARVFYPGDAYVDIIGLDAYDWDPGYTTDANIARHRDGAYGWNFWLDFAKQRGKKFALPEWGVAPANPGGGGDNPKYIAFVYGWLKANQQHIAFETYFQESDAYIRSDLFTNNPKASGEYRRWMGQLGR